MAFAKATKKQAKLRCAVFGPAGSGKTITSLRVAKGIGGNVAVIDTERRTASKYADRFDFDVCDLEDRSIDGYVTTIQEAAQAGYNVLIIDSLSHGWQELLREVDRLAKAKYRGNTWSAWSEGTPEQRRLVDALLSYPGHVLATMRSKTEWTQVETGNGKKRPERIGLAPEQGKGIEYEFDLLLELSTDHIANVIKDRTGKFQDQTIDKPGEEFGASLIGWLNEGAADVASIPPEHFNAVDAMRDLLMELDEKWHGKSLEDVWAMIRKRAEGEGKTIDNEYLRGKIASMQTKIDAAGKENS